MPEWQQLTIYIGESDHWHHQPLYMALVELALKQGLAGATATRAIAGFGKHSTIHTTKILELSSDLPILVTIIDREEAIATFLPQVQEMVIDGLVTLYPVEIVHHVPNLER
ncbi:hypothetical protein CEN40_02125 [Fischerella thermalis CCMEE 5205]|nr:hypothetical protein CEN40_02125 [Fischerella thermalis CCMEE 5205]